MARIFVQIAAYRDPELLPTIKDILEKAENPQDLTFSICWQHNKNKHVYKKGHEKEGQIEDQWDNLDPYINDPRFSIVDMDYGNARGPCYARNLLQKNYKGEEYTLQIDSHSRFAQDWDKMLKDMLRDLQNKGSKKPLITSYAPEYNPETEPNGRYMIPLHLVFDRFSPEGVLHLKPHGMDGWEAMDGPQKARIYSAHFAFSLGDFVLEVPHDPEIYFHGEEPSIGIRAFTHGYDLWHPNKLIMWHFYGRPSEKGYRRHWDDTHGDWTTKSYARFRKLLNVWAEGGDIPTYGLGKERTLEDYERYAGIRFFDLRVQRYTLDCRYPPNPHYPIDSEYYSDKVLLPFYRHCIDVNKAYVPDKDYDYWVVAFIGEDGSDVYRRDADRAEIDSFFAMPEGHCMVWRDFVMERREDGTLKEPVSWRVWPHSISKGYGHFDVSANRFSDQPITGNLVHKKPVVKQDSIVTPTVVEEEPKIEKDGTQYIEFTETTSNPNPVMNIKDVDQEIVMDTMHETILIHIPAYREPELIPTIKDALANAMNPERIRFGICRQFNTEDKFDNLDAYRNDPRFKIMDVPYEDAKGLPWARAQINDNLLTDEDYVLQLDSHHRFVMNWDAILIALHNKLEQEYEKPILTGYSTQYSPITGEKTMEPWMSGFRCFYVGHTIFIGPQLLHGWENMKAPARSRFLCGHFDFGRSQWARDVRHDPTILFASEEINLTVRSYTKGYDFFHPHKICVWHATMREERNGICKWDDDNKKGIKWWAIQDENRRMFRKLIGIEEHKDITILPEYQLGTERTIKEYEKFAGLDFKNRKVQKYTADNQYPPNPLVLNYEESFLYSYYWEVTLHRGSWSGNLDFVLVAYDDANNVGVKSDHIRPDWEACGGIHHYADYFVSDKVVKKIVYLGYGDGQWKERYSHDIK